MDTNYIPVKELSVKVHDVERDALGSMTITASYTVDNIAQRTKIFVVADRKATMKKNPAYRVGLSILSGAVPKGSHFLVDGVVCDKAGLSSKLTVTSMILDDDDDDEQDLFDVMPVKVFTKSPASALNIVQNVNDAMKKLPPTRTSASKARKTTNNNNNADMDLLASYNKLIRNKDDDAQGPLVTETKKKRKRTPPPVVSPSSSEEEPLTRRSNRRQALAVSPATSHISGSSSIVSGPVNVGSPVSVVSSVNVGSPVRVVSSVDIRSPIGVGSPAIVGSLPPTLSPKTKVVAQKQRGHPPGSKNKK
jgi:hypothetical protein